MYSDTPSPPAFRLTQSIPFSAASSTFPSVIAVQLRICVSSVSFFRTSVSVCTFSQSKHLRESGS